MTLQLRAAVFVTAALLSGQEARAQARFEARIGVMASTPLVRDEAAGPVLKRVLRASGDVTELTMRPTPVASLLGALPMGPRTALELSGSVGLTQLRAANGATRWEAQSATIASLAVGARYEYRRNLWLNGGVGVTRFFAGARGIFSEGASFNPLLEAGAMTRLPIAVPVHIAGRLQTHSFGTPALRREGATDGKAIRFLLQLGFGR